MRELLKTLDADLTHAGALWGRPPARRWARSVGNLLLYPRMRAVVWFRLSHCLWRARWLRPFALWIQAHVIRTAGAEIHPAAVLGPGLMLLHSVGIVVGHEVVAGRDLVLAQGVTLGHRDGPGQPCLGDRVRVSAGSSVLGPVTLGDDAVIAAGAVVLTDVPAAHLAAGVPARVRLPEVLPGSPGPDCSSASPTCEGS